MAWIFDHFVPLTDVILVCAYLLSFFYEQGGQIVALSGPSGAGKTATIRVLARELDLDLLEWINPVDPRSLVSMADRAPGDSTRGIDANDNSDYPGRALTLVSQPLGPPQPVAREAGIAQRFAEFLGVARKACPLSFGPSSSSTVASAVGASAAFSPTAASLPSSTPSQRASAPPLPPKQQRRRVILVEDLPNVQHEGTRAAFHAALRAFAASSRSVHPLVLVASDVAVAAADADVRARDRPVCLSTLVPPDVRLAPGFVKIVAPSFLIKALSRIATLEVGSSNGGGGGGPRARRRGAPSATVGPSREALTACAAAAGGDIRCAINALQFSSITGVPPTSSASSSAEPKAAGDAPPSLRHAVGAREAGLVLFHAVSKILVAKHITSESDADDFPGLDSSIEPPDGFAVSELPQHLAHHARPLYKSNPE
ncbi:Cell cycle checkpoint protein rad17, partial [Cladochytrium tenue]